MADVPDLRDVALWTSRFGWRASDGAVRTSHFGRRGSDGALRTERFGRSASDGALRMAHFGRRSSDDALRTSDTRGCRAIDNLSVDRSTIDKVLVVLGEIDGPLVDRNGRHGHQRQVVRTSHRRFANAAGASLTQAGLLCSHSPSVAGAARASRAAPERRGRSARAPLAHPERRSRTLSAASALRAPTRAPRETTSGTRRNPAILGCRSARRARTTP